MAEYNPIIDEEGKPVGTQIDSGAGSDERLVTETGQVAAPIIFKVVKPQKDGATWDQTNDAADHIRYAVSLNLPELRKRPRPRYGRAIIVGGAPSIADHLEEIRVLAADPDNAVFALNWSHTWLIQHGIVPKGCVFFEIDAEPDTVLKAAHPEVTYFICSHCHNKTFDALKDSKLVLWHSPPNSEPEKVVHEELLVGRADDYVGGGISTFTRTISVAMFLGFRHFDLFGCDSSFPEDKGTHVDGYQTIMDAKTDALDIWAKSSRTGSVRKFKTLGYLALQVEEFKTFCQYNHPFISIKVHGDSLLRFNHEEIYPDQYDPRTYYG